ncbi:MAG: LuxR C-terminal-related transcriptional regulator [Chloroflexi bacterium]|nr:LuxR C-terminal-related transcriptional regulator [Chloroflexota bacterium]
MEKTDPLIRTKLRPPFIRPELVCRPRLQTRVAEGLHFPLTLVIAPAGFGKTTLVAASLAGSGMPAAWLTLDKEDNQGGRFLKYLIAALQSRDHQIGSEADRLIGGVPPAPPETVLVSLVNDLDASEAELVLVLEDYQFISNPEIHEAVGFLIEHCPQTFHLLITSRSDPSLPLARLRARSQMVELRSEDLRFTPIEAAQFLNDVMGLGLDAGSVAALEERTEGWIAGLQMAALSLRDRQDVAGFIEAFSGTNRYILDYLLEEVLASQSPEVQRFLLCTSILGRLTAPLCNVVIGEADSQAMLERLERANLFVSSLDDGRQWYRYHQLFGDLLQVRLQQTHPELLSGLHERAVDWYEENGFIVEAIDQALAAKHWSRAARLIEQRAMGILSGESVMALIAWLDVFPEELLYNRPWLCVFRAWSLLLNCQAEGVENLLQRAERNLPIANGSMSNEDIRGNVAMIRAYLALFEGDLERSEDQISLADRLLPDSDRVIRCDLLWVKGFLPFLRDDLSAAAEAWAEARDYSLSSGNPYIAVASIGQLARIDRVQGRLQGCKERYQQALDVAAELSWNQSRLTTFVKKDLADVFCELNELPRASALAEEVVEEAERWGNPSDAAMAHAILAHVLCATGDLDTSRASLDRAEKICRNHTTYPEVHGRVAACQVKLWLRLGDNLSARQWVENNHLHSDDTPAFQTEMEHITLARVLISQNRAAEAAPLLRGLDEAARRGSRSGSRIEILALLALALQVCRDTQAAFSALSTALSLAEPEGYVRVFLDEGQPMRLLLAQWLAHTPSGPLRDYSAHLLAQFEVEPQSAQAAPETASPAGDLVEPLSQRELEVLQLLALGRTNQEIAQQLIVAPGTVKAHTASIYRKLDAANRTEAVARARQLGLLP